MDWMDLDDDGFQVEQYGLPSLVGSGASSHSHSSPSPFTGAGAGEDSIVSLDDDGEEGGVVGVAGGDKSAAGGAAPPIVLGPSLDDDLFHDDDNALTPMGSLPATMSMSLPYTFGARQLVSSTAATAPGFVEPLQAQQPHHQHSNPQLARSVGSGGEFAFTFGSSLAVPQQGASIPIQQQQQQHSGDTSRFFGNAQSSSGTLGGFSGGGMAGARSLPSTSLLASLATGAPGTGTVFTGATIQGGLRSVTGGGDLSLLSVKSEPEDAEDGQSSQRQQQGSGARPKKRARENEAVPAAAVPTTGAAGTTSAGATGKPTKPIGKKRSASTSSANVGAELRALSLAPSTSLATTKEQVAPSQEDGTSPEDADATADAATAADNSTRAASEAMTDAVAPSANGSAADGDGNAAPKKKSFKPWNTSPASSHLPSGSACINPVTGEVELPDLQNLTKEEIRKVKNRASAQRSRTRKSEQAVTLREENAKLRHQIEVLNAKIEGREPNPESVNALAAAARLELDHDEEKAAMQNMIQALRDEVMRERHAREMAEHEIARLHAHVEGRPLAAIHHPPQINDALPAMPMSRAPSEERLVAADDLLDGEERMMPIHHHMPPSHQVTNAAAASSLIRRHKSTVGNVVGRSEGKGVLMMVVLFSFALFSIPPHMRSAGYSTAFHMPISGPTDMNALTRLLPFDDVKVDAHKKQSTGAGQSANGSSDDKEDVEPASNVPRKDAMRGTKSVSFTLLRPISGQADEDTALAEQSSSSEVESVLEKWLGLSLGERSSSSAASLKADAATESDAGWVVLNSPFKEETPRASIASQPHSSGPSSAPLSSRSSVSAWHGGELEPMDLDNELLSISTLFEADTRTHNLNLPFEPDQRRPTFGPSPTLAPHILEDPLTEDQADHTRDVRSSSVPLFMAAGHDVPSTPLANTRRRQSVSVPSMTTGSTADRPAAPASSAALMALSRSSAERYMKLEVEMDIEVEFTCKGLRRRRQQASVDGGDDRLQSGSKRDGMSVVGREEVGRLLKGNVLSIGDGQPASSLLGLGVGL